MNKTQQFWILAGSICAYNMSSFSWHAQPVIVDTLLNNVALTGSVAGLVVSIELLAMAIVSFSVAPWLPKYPVKKVCYGAGAITILGHFLSTATVSFELLFIIRLIVGCAEGLLLAFANALLASASKPDRAYAILHTWNVAFGVVLVMIMPGMERAYGVVAVFGLIGLACVINTPFLRRLPEYIEIQPQPKLSSGRTAVTIVSLFAIFVWTVPAAMIWAFFIPIGDQTTLLPEVISIIIAVSAAGGLLGGIFAAYVGGRYGRFIPFVLGLIAHVAIFMAITHIPHNWVFIIAAPAAICSVYFLLPLYQGMAAEHDPNGRLAASVIGLYVLAGGSGPVVGGFLVDIWGLKAIGWAAVAGSSLSGLSVVWLNGQRLPDRPTPTSGAVKSLLKSAAPSAE